MHRDGWFKRYLRVFFASLAVAVALRLWLIVGVLTDLVERIAQRIGFSANGWLVKIEFAAWTLVLASGAAIVVSLAARTYERLERADREGSDVR